MGTCHRECHTNYYSPEKGEFARMLFKASWQSSRTKQSMLWMELCKDSWEITVSGFNNNTLVLDATKVEGN